MNFNFKKTLLAFLFFGLFIFYFFDCFVFAQENNKDEIKFLIAPPVFEPFLKKGEIYKGKILVENKNNFLLPVEINLTNFDSQEESGVIKFQRENEAVDWFSIENPNFILKAKEKRWINFEIKVPTKAKKGCYYVSVIFKPKISPTQIKENQTIFIPNLTSLFLIGVEDKGKVSFDIVNIETKKNLKGTFLKGIFKADFITDDFFIPFEAKIKNNGVCHIRPKGTLKIFGKGGRRVGEIKIEGKTILPQRTRIISFNFYPSFYERIKKHFPDFLAKGIVGGLFFGRYKAFLTLHGSAFVEKEFEIFIFPWKNFLIILIFIFILILIFAFCKIKKIGKNKEKKTKRDKKIEKGDKGKKRRN